MKTKIEWLKAKIKQVYKKKCNLNNKLLKYYLKMLNNIHNYIIDNILNDVNTHINNILNNTLVFRTKNSKTL